MNLARFFHMFRTHSALSASILARDHTINSLRYLVQTATEENEGLVDRLTLANHLVFKQATELATAEAVTAHLKEDLAKAVNALEWVMREADPDMESFAPEFRNAAEVLEKLSVAHNL